MDPPLKDWIFTKPDVVAIEYHTSFPYAGDPFYTANPSEVNNRVFYYQVPSVPSIRMDGPYAPSQNNPAAYETLYQQRRAIPARARLELEGEYDPAERTGTLTVRAIAEESMPGDWRLRVAVTESDIFFEAPNGIDVHHHVFRRFLPDTAGTALTFPGPFPDTRTIELPFVLDAGWAEENVDLVVLLQEQGSREIEQGGAFGVSGLLTAVEGGVVPLPALDRIATLHPNPFASQASIHFELARAGQVVLTVHHANGRLVRTLVGGALPSGRHVAAWDGRGQAGQELAAGVYLVRLSGPVATSSRKLILLH